MTPIEIAYFKHFLFDKSLERDFQYFYRTRRIKGSPSGDKGGNPESIEEYFMKTSRHDVIMKAFYFAPTNNNAQRLTATYDYWKDIDDKWQEYMRQNEMNFSNDSWPNLRKSFAILRQNWDVPYYWRHENLESTEEVYKRMHIDLPLPEFRWEHGYIKREERPDSNLIDYDIHNAKDGDFVVRTRLLKGGGIGRTIFIMKEVVPYDPETSEFTPEQLHCDYDPEKGNVYIAYLHARYTNMGDSFSTDYADNLHAVIDDSSTTEKYRLAFKEEEQAMILKLADNQFAWNPDTKTIVPLLEALEAMNGKPAEKVNPKGDIPLINFSDNEDDDPLADFDFLDLPTPMNVRLKSDEVSLNFNSNSYKITFNRFTTEYIKKAGMTFARLAKNKSGDICLILNRHEGTKLSKSTYNNGARENITINSKEITTKLRTLLNIRADYSVLVIQQLASTSDYMIYKLSKQ